MSCHSSLCNFEAMNNKRVEGGNFPCHLTGCCGQASHHLFPSQPEGEFACGDCGKTFVHEKSYKAHMLSHSGAFSCNVCSKNFSNVANLNIHSRIHSGVKPFKCESCSTSFRTSSMYKRHLAKEHPDKIANFSSPTYECPNCNRKLRSFASYQKHVARHDVQNLHVCELCQVDCFTHDAYLSHHKRCHSGEKGKTVLEKLQRNTCHICKNSFYTISALWDHATLYHAPFLGLPCNVCGKLVTSRNAYMTHRRTHLEAKDYICHICERSFNKASHLQDHVRVHVQDYTYKCPVCGKGFLRPKNLKTHLLAKHRPTVDKCCLRTLQRRKKTYEVDNDASSNISDSSIGSSSSSSECNSSSGSSRFRLRIRPIIELEEFLQAKTEIKVESSSLIQPNLDPEIPDSNDFNNDYSNTSDDNDTNSDCEWDSGEQKVDRVNLDATFLQVSAFPKFDWKRVPTMYAEEPSHSPYVDVRGHPLFSKNKPAPMTKKLVDMAKSSQSQKKTAEFN